jgi:hypothetical protein
MPYCTLGQALVGVDSGSLIILHEVMTDPFAYPVDSLDIQIDIAIFAAGEEAPALQGTSGAPAFTVTAAGDLFMRGVTIAGTQGGGSGMLVSGGNAWIEQSRIVNNSGGGIVVDGGGMLVLENSFVGGDQNDMRAVDVVDGTVSITYSTLAGGFGAAYALWCTDGTNTTVRNSLLVARTANDEVSCPNAVVTDNALETDVAGNVALGPMPDMTSDWFASYGTGDFSLAVTHPAAIDTAATWQTGDPTTDIDGDPRPTTDGAPDFAGADVIP